ncbi:hypothetical protein DPMN_042852 [Dreissena polymorpha]|uniref:Uncharacterized protein n=1 Tax=Dreissena polymorpha TaxID=45954 RepID=A0A9D4D153_DREPO|nr:hypothetical protein DPMN_042852 [Dreissena polymorpha]
MGGFRGQSVNESSSLLPLSCLCCMDLRAFSLRALSSSSPSASSLSESSCEMKNAPPTGDHVFQATGTIFELFHEDRTINMASRVLTRKNATPPWRPYIIGTNHLTKFHDDRTINVASRVLTRQKAPPPGGHIFLATDTIFKLIQDIIRTNHLAQFHEDRKIKVASRVLTRKNAPLPGGHVFQPTGIIFSTHQTINVASRVKNAPPLGSHVFQANVTLFTLIQDIIKTNLLTKFHEDWTINLASRVFTRFYYGYILKTTCPPGGYVFSLIWTIFELIRDINQTNVLKTTCPPGGHVFSLIWTIFELIRDINETNVLTMFHDDWAKIVTSRVFTRNTALPPGGHLHEDWASNVTSTVFTSFELSRGINGTNVLTKFHEDQAINVASSVHKAKC